MSDSGLHDTPPRLLKIEAVRQDGVDIFAPEGAIDMSTIDEFERKLRPACTAPQARVIVDCTRLTYLNSSSLGLFYKFFNTCRNHSGAFALCAVSDKIREIIKLLGLDKVLVLYGTREEALRRMQGGPRDEVK